MRSPAVSRAALALLVLAACDGGVKAAGEATRDAGPADVAGDPRPDARARDGAVEDAGARDAGSTEAGALSPDIHYLGRFDTRDPAGPRFAWPGSAIVATFTGTGITATLGDTGSNFFAVAVDGDKPKAFQTSTGSHAYVLASGLAAGRHTVTLTKRTESWLGVVQLLAFTPKEGAIVASPEPFRRRIELIGDSITCGYGDLGTCDPAGTCCGFTAATEDETVAYGGLTAAALDAQQTAIAYSGIGMLRNGDRSTTGIMPIRYPRALADDPTSEWSFSTPAPDVVVINLGTNDFWTGDPGSAFVTAYEDFVTTELRPHYPNAFIVCALGPMTHQAPKRTAERAAIQAVVKDLVAAGDGRVSYFEFDLQSQTANQGCDGHPSAATQKQDADKLVLAIRGLTGW